MQIMYDTFFINGILDPITGDVVNILTLGLSVWQYATNKNKKKLNHNFKDRETLTIGYLYDDKKGTSLHFVEMHPTFHTSPDWE